jgi:hypothetical protein
MQEYSKPKISRLLFPHTSRIKIIICGRFSESASEEVRKQVESRCASREASCSTSRECCFRENRHKRRIESRCREPFCVQVGCAQEIHHAYTCCVRALRTHARGARSRSLVQSWIKGIRGYVMCIMNTSLYVLSILLRRYRLPDEI